MQAFMQRDTAIFRELGQTRPTGHLFDIPAHRNALFGLCGKTIHFILKAEDSAFLLASSGAVQRALSLFFGLAPAEAAFAFLVKKARNKFHETVPCLLNGVLN
ncbi:hypothetical protein DRW41_20985 [Neobacillus piezotolerans]|uniref:Uncharacterized protein n=1 Tax=Neobacillus piezotolerans TaxID=2259171 RepID=A0A3D8GKW8_9BACI|nr:hypothetical protein [Neobacillus piezotolerans]RDU34937.1 hypothetical protein DRW41_20985 [Neobacillus piezotolerans]